MSTTFEALKFRAFAKCGNTGRAGALAVPGFVDERSKKFALMEISLNGEIVARWFACQTELVSHVKRFKSKSYKSDANKKTTHFGAREELTPSFTSLLHRCYATGVHMFYN